MYKISSNSFLQFWKFSLIGVANTSIHYAIFWCLFKSGTCNYLLASGIGYSCGLTNSYVLNRKFTFRAVNRATLFEFNKFVVVNALALLLNLAVLSSLVKFIHLLPEVSQIFAIGGSYVTNFLGNKIWTFRPKSNRLAE